MRTVQELRELRERLTTTLPIMPSALEGLLVELLDDLIVRREADEAKAVGAKAEALRARVYAECSVSAWRRGDGPEELTLTHKPTGVSASGTTGRTAVLADLMTQLRERGAI